MKAAKPTERDPLWLLLVLGLSVALGSAVWLLDEALVERMHFPLG